MVHAPRTLSPKAVRPPDRHSSLLSVFLRKQKRKRKKKVRRVPAHRLFVPFVLSETHEDGDEDEDDEDEGEGEMKVVKVREKEQRGDEGRWLAPIGRRK